LLDPHQRRHPIHRVAATPQSAFRAPWRCHTPHSAFRTPHSNQLVSWSASSLRTPHSALEGACTAVPTSDTAHPLPDSGKPPPEQKQTHRQSHLVYR
jgi:hypothetical protein